VDAIKGDSMTTPVDLDADDARLARNDQLVFVRLAVKEHVGAVWQALVSPPGTAVWLGEGAVLGDKGQSYHCADGSAGVVRSFHPLEQLRLSWHSGAETEPSLIEVDVTADGDGTRVRLWHEGLPAEQRSAMRAHWRERLEALLTTPPGR
jgi:uncharacterized protein YndB with AHSA1/START domain